MTFPDLENHADEELLDLINQGSHPAFSTLVKRHATRFYRVAFHMLSTREDAEDMVQECFMKLWKEPGIWKQGKGAKFTTWFYRIVINRCNDHLKKKKEERLQENFDVEDERTENEDNIDNEAALKKLNEGFSMLSERQKTALSLSYYESVSNKEAAEIMGLSTRAFQSLLIRSKQALKEQVYKLGGTR